MINGEKNIHTAPKLIKIHINRGLGLSGQNTGTLKQSISEFRLITGQQPIITKAAKAISSFKIREGMVLGISVTLRGKKRDAFLNRFVNLALPRSRDFQGLNPKGFDNEGNYNVGLTDQFIFPELTYNLTDQTRGFDITFVTSAKTREEGMLLLRSLGLPIRDKIKN